jgi:hypothetical protein
LQIKIFTLPFSARLGGFEDEPLRTFVADKQVQGFEAWHFVHDGMPYWSVLVTYQLREAESEAALRKEDTREKGKENWRKLLSDADWPVFNALREWRKGRANEDGLPPYLVFTNEQLTRMVVDRADSLAALGRIQGVGPSRVEKYGKDVLRILHERGGADAGRPEGTAGTDGVAGVPGVAVADDGEVPEEGSVHPDAADRQLGPGRGDDPDGGAIHEEPGGEDT